MLRCLPIFLVLLTTLSCAADPVEVQAPYLEVGDCWTYSAKKMYRSGRIESYRECITYIDTAKNALLALATTQPAGVEIETSYTLGWGEITAIDGRVRRPPVDWLRFPLRVGDSHKVAWNFFNRINGVMGDSEANAKIIGWEDITVPAGKYRALRIEATGLSVSPLGRAGIRVVFWYVPAVKRFVKVIYDVASGDGYEIELMRTELNP